MTKNNKTQSFPGKILIEGDRTVTLQLTINDWINVPSHPRQRDTQRHSKAAHWRDAKNAKGALKIHLANVIGAILDGVLYKVDGHTRSYLWVNGLLKKPSHVIVTAYFVKDKNELNALYGVMDLTTAAERPSDQICGAYKEYGLSLKSKRLSGGNIGEALHLALRGQPKARRSKKQQTFDLYEAVGVFTKELTIIDNLNVNPKVFSSGILAAALLMQALHPETLEFFRLLAERKGEKRNGRTDPVESVLDVIDEHRYSRQNYSGVGQLDLLARCVHAVYIWLEGPESSRFWLKNKVYAYELRPLIFELRKMKNIEDNPRL